MAVQVVWSVERKGSTDAQKMGYFPKALFSQGENLVNCRSRLDKAADFEIITDGPSQPAMPHIQCTIRYSY